MLAGAHLNVVDMINRSRDTLAYNLIDVASKPDAAAIKAIESVANVIRVRVI